LSATSSALSEASDPSFFSAPVSWAVSVGAATPSVLRLPAATPSSRDRPTSPARACCRGSARSAGVGSDEITAWTAVP
jgi:hypothetical protein